MRVMFESITCAYVHAIDSNITQRTQRATNNNTKEYDNEHTK